MDHYLSALGWWNLAGCFLMFGVFNESFGRKVLNDWTKIFHVEYSLDYWSKFWLAWAIGLNIFFAMINILSVKWGYMEVKIFITWIDIIAYSLFGILCFWGLKERRVASGVYSAIIIFLVWISWGIYVLMGN